MKRSVLIIFIIILLFAGIAFMLYPTLSDYWNVLHQSSATVDYANTVNAFEDGMFDEMWDRAVEYNKQLYEKSCGKYVADPIPYDSVLNVTDNGMMAYIDIPKINVHLPLYHTVEEGVLQSNAGHVETSSLPVGGENTHCVISGHTGLPSARLFTDLERIVVGDTFTINTLGVVLTYEVDQIVVVNPWESDELRIFSGKDYCTLLTCTPYGVNSHRLLVRGHRIETTEEVAAAVLNVELVYRKTAEPFFIAVGVAVLIIIIAIILVVIRLIVNRKRKKNEKHTQSACVDNKPCVEEASDAQASNVGKESE